MDPFARRRLGRTQVEVTQLGFGGAGLGDLFEVIPEAQAAATLQAAWDAGIRYYDTAPWYGLTQSEHRFGRALYRQPRRDFVLSTKVGRTLHPVHDSENFDRGMWSGGLPFRVQFDYSYDGVMRSFEDSLQRLGLSRIDLLLIHDLDLQYHKTNARVEARLTELHNGGVRALAELKAAGRIGGFGAGINERGMIPRFLDLIDVDFFLVAMPYTLLDQQVLDSEFPRCTERGIGFVIGAVFASGILATGAVQGARYAYAPAAPEILAKVARIEAVCDRHGVPMAAAALQFPFGHPSVASVVPGSLAPEHVTSNVAAFRHPIPPALWAELKHEGLLRADAPTP
jgi:D-threo-aldose 1-dehydrogenase